MDPSSKGGQQKKTFVTMDQSKHAQQYTIYTLPRRFRDDAKLHPFLAEKRPDLIKLNKKEYTLYDVSIMENSIFHKVTNLLMILFEYFRFCWVWDKWFQRRSSMTPITQLWLSVVQGLKQLLTWNPCMSLKSGINLYIFHWEAPEIDIF